MNNATNKNNPARSGQHPGASESEGSQETFPQRTKRPGEAGLANETRPGLGTRSQGRPASKAPSPEAKENDENTENPLPPPPARRPEPTEQDPNSLQHELERDTGVSGHSGGT